MPCGCFGKKNKNAEKEEEKWKKAPPTLGGGGTPLDTAGEVKGKQPDDDAGKASKRRDVVASYCEDECALLGYRSTGSRPPSSYVDSPPTSNDSHTHTPSTMPVAASSSTASRASSSAPSSPPASSRSATASSRAELAEKRREFFKEFYQRSTFSGRGASASYLPSTLPTAARARQFGKVRPMRPASQPTSPTDSPPEVSSPPPPPPGPHLLRPRPVALHDDPENHSGGGFSSSDFIRELQSASNEISRRWAMSEEELEEEGMPLGLKMRPLPPRVLADGDEEQEEIPREALVNGENDMIHSQFLPSNVDEGRRGSGGVPETLITPPSPTAQDISEQLSPPRSHSQSPVPGDPPDAPSLLQELSSSPPGMQTENGDHTSFKSSELLGEEGSRVCFTESSATTQGMKEETSLEELPAGIGAHGIGIAVVDEEEEEGALDEDIIRTMSSLQKDDSFDLSDEPAWEVSTEERTQPPQPHQENPIGMGTDLNPSKSSPDGEESFLERNSDHPMTSISISKERLINTNNEAEISDSITTSN